MANLTDALIERIWEKATAIEGYDATRWRQDFAGAWIQKEQYGIQSTFGWEVDHMIPLAHGGTDDISNLNPIHWENNRKKGADYPNFESVVSSEGNKNIYKNRRWVIQ